MRFADAPKKAYLRGARSGAKVGWEDFHDIDRDGWPFKVKQLKKPK